MIAHYGIESGQFEISGFYDNAIPKGTNTRYGAVLGNTSELRPQLDEGRFDSILVGIGYENWKWRGRFFDEFGDLEIPNLVHPSAYVNDSAKLGRGVVILPRSVVDMHCVLGNNVFLNPGVIIAHDSQVEDHCFVAPGVNISGYSRVGPRCFIGIGTSIVNDVNVCGDCTLGAGTVVTQSITVPGTYAGTPARLLSKDAV